MNSETQQSNTWSFSLRNIDAVSKLLWVVLSIVGAAWVRGWGANASLTAVLMIYLLAPGNIGLIKLINELPKILMLPLCLLLFHAFTHEGRILLSFPPLSITWEGLEVGGVLFFRVAFVVLISSAFLWTTDIRELMAGLIRLGMPYRFAFAVYLGLRYIPIMRTESGFILDAITMRCQQSRVGTEWRIRLWMRYVVLLALIGLRKADQTSAAMQLRGFGLHSRRSLITPFHFTSEGLALVFVTALVILYLS